MEASLNLAGRLYDSRSFGVVIGDRLGLGDLSWLAEREHPTLHVKRVALPYHALRPFLLCSCSSQDASLFDCLTDSTRLQTFLLVLLGTVDSAYHPHHHISRYIGPDS
jgi:hypothetical protein